jgi:hypothetical protein
MRKAYWYVMGRGEIERAAAWVEGWREQFFMEWKSSSLCNLGNDGKENKGLLLFQLRITSIFYLVQMIDWVVSSSWDQFTEEYVSNLRQGKARLGQANHVWTSFLVQIWFFDHFDGHWLYLNFMLPSRFWWKDIPFWHKMGFQQPGSVDKNDQPFATFPLDQFCCWVTPRPFLPSSRQLLFPLTHLCCRVTGATFASVIHELLDPTVWLCGARPANACILPSYWILLFGYVELARQYLYPALLLLNGARAAMQLTLGPQGAKLGEGRGS